MPRILHLFNVFGAPTEKTMLDYPLALAGRGWDVTVGYETLDPSAPATELRTIPLRRVQVGPTDDVPAQLRRVADAAPRDDPALRSLLYEKFDLVHGHFGPRILQAAPFLLRGVPMIVSLYGYDATRLLRDPTWIGRYRWAAERGATFVTLAHSMFDRMLAVGLPRERLRLIRLGVELDAHAYDPQPAPPRPRFVFIGRLVEKKGAEVLLRAAALLAARGQPSFTVEIVGDGPLMPSLRRLTTDLGLLTAPRRTTPGAERSDAPDSQLTRRHAWQGDSNEVVDFVGRVPFHALFDRLHGATALVQPSVVAADGDSEGAPMVLMHAQAAGVPCITTAHAGNPEVLPPTGQRFVVPERDAGALADALCGMIALSGTDRRALQDAGRAWIESRYSMRETVGGYEALYHALTGGPSGGNAAEGRD